MLFSRVHTFLELTIEDILGNQPLNRSVTLVQVPVHWLLLETRWMGFYMPKFSQRLTMRKQQEY